MPMLPECPQNLHRGKRKSKTERLIILNLTRNVQMTHIEEIFGSFGTLKSVEYPINKYNSFIHDGYAIIEYKSRKHSKLAYKYMDGGQVDGKVIRIKPYTSECTNIFNDTNNYGVVPQHIVNSSKNLKFSCRLSNVESPKDQDVVKSKTPPAVSSDNFEKEGILEHDDLSSCDSLHSPCHSIELGVPEKETKLIETDVNKTPENLNQTEVRSSLNNLSKLERKIPYIESDDGYFEPTIDKDKIYQIAKENLRKLMYFGEISKDTELYRLAEEHIQRWNKEDRMARRSQRIGRRYSDSDEEFLGNSVAKRSLKKSQPIEIKVTGGHRSESPEDLRYLYPVSRGFRPVIRENVPWVEVDPDGKIRKKKSKLDLEGNTADKTVSLEIDQIDHEMVWPGLGLDVGTLHAQRLNSVKKLEKDPGNLVAIRQLDSMDRLIKVCENTRQPFNRTDSNDESKRLILPQGEGLGQHLLKKMGWKPGTGLGRHEQGMIEPLAPKTQLDTRGLVTEDEKVRDLTRQLVQSSPDDVTMWSKTPVSILNEHCWRAKRLVPNYELIHEDGPAHRKNFQYKVTIDGVTYQSTVSSGNKKEAKQVAAAVAAEAFGLLTD